MVRAVVVDCLLLLNFCNMGNDRLMLDVLWDRILEQDMQGIR